MQKLGVFLGFVPWIVFAVLAGPTTFVWAALAALAVTLVLAVPDWVRTRTASPLDVAGVAFFGVLCVLPLALHGADLQWVEDRAPMFSNLMLGAVAAGSLLVRRPFTEFYARRSVPREYWARPLFRKVNMVITAVWGATFLLTALCHLVVLAAPGTGIVFSWVVPVLLIVAAVKFTVWYPDHVRHAPGTPADDRTVTP